MIFSVIGTPEDDDKSFVTDSKAIQYLGAFKHLKKIDFSKKYPGAGEVAIDLLQKMLLFNPYFRITIDGALAHPFFDKVRKLEKQIESKVKITIEFDSGKEILDKKRLRELFLEEIKSFKSRPESKF